MSAPNPATQQAHELMENLLNLCQDSSLPLPSQIGVLSHLLCHLAEFQSGREIKNVLLVPSTNAMVINIPVNWSELQQMVRETPDSQDNQA